ncbi:uncharacterized protein N7483_011975 [Penicillium malachiteum]|uniref:uncharacterized protein n=1 Tax=Penicillium malachiteum TaxID=1324776 RepID=UPI00254661BC|nr:uncharacterized protein N7483_011975 [Penicillium malachiteum]KAJ5714794.1 hypothetical protein N7483_011975 [Penicillium malachiteum]
MAAREAQMSWGLQPSQVRPGYKTQGGSDQDPAKLSDEDLQNETVSIQNLETNESIRKKEDGLGNIYAEHSRSISNADPGLLSRGQFQEEQTQSPMDTAFNASQMVPDEEFKEFSPEPYEGLDQLPWAIPQLTYSSYDSTTGVEQQPESERDLGPDSLPQISLSKANFNRYIEEPQPENDDEGGGGDGGGVGDGGGGGFSESSSWRQVSNLMKGVTTSTETENKTSVFIPALQKGELHRKDGNMTAGPDYSRQNWADFYRPEWIDPTSGSQSLEEDATHNSQVRSEDGHPLIVETVPSHNYMDEEYHQDSQGGSHVNATNTEKETQPIAFALNGMTLNLDDQEGLKGKSISIRTGDRGSIRLDNPDGPTPAPNRSSNSYVEDSPYYDKTGGSIRRQAPENGRHTRDRKIDHRPDSHQSSQPWKIPELNVVPPPGDEADTKEEPVLRSSPALDSGSLVSWGQAETQGYGIPSDDEPDENRPQVQTEERVPRRRERDSAGSANRHGRRPGISFPDYESFSDYYMKKEDHGPQRELALEELPEPRSSEILFDGIKLSSQFFIHNVSAR